MSDLIERQAAIDTMKKKIRYTDHDEPVIDWHDFVVALWLLPSAQSEVANDTNVPINDCVSRQAMFDTAAEYEKQLREILGDENELAEVVKILKHRLIALPSAQPETCDTCKHGYFGDMQCENCCVRYPSHYERRPDEQTD